MSYQNPDPLLTRREAAARIGATARWLELQAWKGSGPPYFKIGGRTRYRQSELDQWLEAQRVEPIAPGRAA